MYKWIGTMMLAFLLSGCGTVPAEEVESAIAASSSFEQGVSYAVSPGQYIADYYTGYWLPQYAVVKVVRVEGLEDPIETGHILTARWRHDVTRQPLLVADDWYDGQIAIECDVAGNVATGTTALQVSGGRRGKQWRVIDSGKLFERAGYVQDLELGGASGWKLQYVGVQGKLLRFTIQELGFDHQRLGQVEYTHDLGAGAEFVFRNTRLRVDSVAPDGTLRYTVLASAALK